MRPRDLRLMTQQAAAEMAVAAVGCGYDLSSDLRLTYCKTGPSGSRLIELDGTLAHDLMLPGGIVVPGVPHSIKCDKGERLRFRSDVVSFHQMAEQFNQSMLLSGKIPSGLFNATFEYRGCWQKDASGTKNLCFDGWFITLYSIELARSHIVLNDQVKQDVPSSWDPAALAEFIEKYGTHIIVGVKMGGKDIICIKQQQESVLQQTEVQDLLKRLADERFSEDFCGNFALGADEFSKKLKDSKLTDQERNLAVLKSVRPSVVSHSKKDDIVSIHVRRGGINTNQSHNQWLSTIPESPWVISMSFVPITSLLGGVQGSGFLSHAVNLYLRYKPPLEELRQFLEFQLPRQWAPAFGELPLGPQRKKHSMPSLQFTFMGPKLYVKTAVVDSGNHPVTGIRLYLEGKKNDCLAIHLQHLCALPSILQLSDDTAYADDDSYPNERAYYEPIKWTLLSHVCTAPVQFIGSIDDSAFIVTKAWLEVREIGMRKVLFLRLGFSNIASMKIRRSEWDGPTSITRKSGSISALISSRFSTGQMPEPKPKMEVNSAIFPKGPPVPIRVPRMSRFVDTTEMKRGPDDLPGYWVVTGAKLCVEGGKISLKVKYSLLVPMPEDDL
ncbi:MACPF domain-containing protein NSL1 isoform X1 [Elaeis guineensis]|uniref:MACPF domain-containing protein NSL1 isoform X1 n=1 Tax=Elaeis guineensis var. tenera TaxID=51953 RepID=A0A6I9QZG9_ELAGV|nr:MACPF domain-containing protein NSL1 isoform X1 [Elaeis guineensis]